MNLSIATLKCYLVGRADEMPFALGKHSLLSYCPSFIHNAKGTSAKPMRLLIVFIRSYYEGDSQLHLEALWTFLLFACNLLKSLSTITDVVITCFLL